MPDCDYVSMNSLSPAPATLGLPDIAFCGKAGAGKSSAAELLAELGYTRLSIGTPIKTMAHQLWGDDVHREELQKLGEAVVGIHEDTWLSLLLRRLHTGRAWAHPAAQRSSPVCVDDVRRPSEADALRGEGFVLVRINAPRPLCIDRLKSNGKFQTDEQLDDVTETALDDYPADHSVSNITTKNDLFNDLVDVLLKERKRR